MLSANNEWLKILLSAVIGMLAGLLADPIRNVIQIRLTTVRMECAIRFDFLTLFTSIKALEHGLVPNSKFWLSVELPAFEYYWDKHRELFYNSFDLHTLRLHCMLVQRLKDRVVSDPTFEEEAMKQLNGVVALVHGMQKPLTWKRRIMFRFVR